MPRSYRHDLNNKRHYNHHDHMDHNVKLLHSPLTLREQIARDAFQEYNLAGAIGRQSFVFPGRSVIDINRILSSVPDSHITINDDEEEEEMVMNKKKKQEKKHLLFSIPTRAILLKEQPCPLIKSGKLRQSNIITPLTNPNNVQYYPSFVCRESSGPITSIAFNQATSLKGLQAMVGACALNDQTYNRPGEILSMTFSNTVNNGVECKVFAETQGHFVSTLGITGGDIKIRSTVAEISFNPEKNHFTSVGYDGKLVLWSSLQSNKEMAKISPSIGNSPLNCLVHTKPAASLTLPQFIAAGGQDGFMHLCSTDTFRVSSSHSLARKTPTEWTNSIDAVAFDRQRQRIVGMVGYNEDCHGGQVTDIDLEKEEKLIQFSTQTTGLTCIDLEPITNDIMAIGSGAVLERDTAGIGEAFLVDRRNASIITSLKSNQFDMDSIKFNPSGDLIAITDAIENTVMVYDLKYPSKPLFSFTHKLGDINDGMMALVWSSHADRLITGGVDGNVLIHDIQKPSQPIQTIPIGHQINAIACSSNDSTMLIGTDFGTVHCFSMNPSIASNLVSSTFATTFY